MGGEKGWRGETPQVQQQPDHILDVRRHIHQALIKNQDGSIHFFK